MPNRIMPGGDGCLAPGTEVALVSLADDSLVELARVAEVRPECGDLSVEGYSARFRLCDGLGLPLVEQQRLPSCEVLDLRGRVLRAANPAEPVVVRRLPARHRVRLATDSDRRAARG